MAASARLASDPRGSLSATEGPAVTAIASERATVELRGVTKVFPAGAGSITALDDVSLSVRPGEFVCIIGA